MVSFRRFVLAMAVLALFVGLAGAQTTTTGSGSGQLQCVATTANPTSARVEGHTELLGDIVITCTGGVAPGLGQPIPTANITVALNSAQVTSRVFSNGLSEALLLVDEPGLIGTTPGAGSLLPQVNCAANIATGGSVLVGAGFGGCQVFAATLGVTGGTPNPTTVGGICAAPSGGTCPAFSSATPPTAVTVPNVFQGIVNNNQVIFNGVPILAPVTAGLSRTFRITNIRGDVSAIGSTGFPGTQPVFASVTISTIVQVQQPVQTVAFLFNGLGSTSVRLADNSGGGTSISVLQCNTAGLTPGAVLRFPEGFANAFKTRIFPGASGGGTTTLSGAGTTSSGALVTVPTNQNVPGFIYNGSESGFVLPVTGGTAGLADFGTRLKATFNNVPSGISLFVTTTNINPLGNTGAAANTNTNVSTLAGLLAGNANIPTSVNSTVSFLAGLVTSETSTAAVGGFLPLAASSNTTSAGAILAPVTIDPATGTGTAVWEVFLANPAAAETAEFGVFFTLNGNPATNTPPITPTATVTMSFAPTTTSATGAGGLIPRFVPGTTSSTIATVSLCQTTLLFPFVNSTPGFDTGIAIANTTSDPFGTRTQTGPCTLNFFGSGAGTTTTAPFPTGGGNIAPGTLNAEQVSNIRNGFSGYIIAVCNFQLAHGYALFSDTGIRNWATGYLPMVLPTGSGARNGQRIVAGPGAAGSVEGLGH